LETQKHKDKKELFALKLSTKNPAELLAQYETSDIEEIVTKIESISDIGYICNTTMSSSNISNKDALREKIHEIHNYIRNNGGGLWYVCPEDF
jgi:hypothetical protein